MRATQAIPADFFSGIAVIIICSCLWVANSVGEEVSWWKITIIFAAFMFTHAGECGLWNNVIRLQCLKLRKNFSTILRWKVLWYYCYVASSLHNYLFLFLKFYTWMISRGEQSYLTENILRLEQQDLRKCLIKTEITCRQDGNILSRQASIYRYAILPLPLHGVKENCNACYCV